MKYGLSPQKGHIRQPKEIVHLPTFYSVNIFPINEIVFKKNAEEEKKYQALLIMQDKGIQLALILPRLHIPQ